VKLIGLDGYKTTHQNIF